MELVADFAAIAWNPEIRNILSLLVGIGILMGSVYLLLATNTGARLGLLISLASLLGWITIMGVIWMAYGIGLRGSDPTWSAIEINHGDLVSADLVEARVLPLPADLPDPDEVLQDNPELEEIVFPEGRENLPDPTLGQIMEADPELRESLGLDEDGLNGWFLLIPSDPIRGEAQAAADAALGPDGNGVFQSTSEYRVLDAFSFGGEERIPDDSGALERAWLKIRSTLRNLIGRPEHFAVVQVQRVIPQETEPGQAPPAPQVDPDAPVESVILVRDYGDRRFPPFMVTVVSAVLFGITCNALHRRDKIAARNRAATG
ncbi:MAG: hypothetical protein ACRD0A_02825 [Acidimicrobiales bacterium]